MVALDEARGFPASVAAQVFLLAVVRGLPGRKAEPRASVLVPRDESESLLARLREAHLAERA